MAKTIFTSQVMKKKLLKIGIWIWIWIVFSIGFLDYLPQDPHVPVSVLISPLLFPFDLFDAFFYPPELELVFGALFWIVVGILLCFPRNQNHIKSK